MPRDQIQGTNPGSVSNMPASRTGDELATKDDCTPPIPDLRKPMLRRNIAALLSCISGLLALACAACMYSAVTERPQWLASALTPVPFGAIIAGFLVMTFIAGFLMLASLLLGIIGIVIRSTQPTAKGLFLAFSGIATGGLALWVTLNLPYDHLWP